MQQAGSQMAKCSNLRPRERTATGTIGRVASGTRPVERREFTSSTAVAVANGEPPFSFFRELAE
jgi:hypothetical protein